MKILVVGEAMIDRYWIGTSSRLSPEAPVPVVGIQQIWDFPGGAANVVENLKALGVEVEERFSNGRPIKNRLMSGSHQIARWDQDDKCSVTYWIELDELLVDGVIISDYGKGGLPDPKYLAETLPKVPTFIDSKGNPLAWATFFGDRPTFYFPNLKEYHDWPDEYDDLEDRMILKRGPEGLQWMDYKVPAKAKQVVNVSGAGDTVVAAFAYCYLDCPIKQDIPTCLEFASRAAGIVVGKPFTAVATTKEMQY